MKNILQFVKYNNTKIPWVEIDCVSFVTAEVRIIKSAFKRVSARETDIVLLAQKREREMDMSTDALGLNLSQNVFQLPFTRKIILPRDATATGCIELAHNIKTRREINLILQWNTEFSRRLVRIVYVGVVVPSTNFRDSGGGGTSPPGPRREPPPFISSVLFIR